MSLHDPNVSKAESLNCIWPIIFGTILGLPKSGEDLCPFEDRRKGLKECRSSNFPIEGTSKIICEKASIES